MKKVLLQRITNLQIHVQCSLDMQACGITCTCTCTLGNYNFLALLQMHLIEEEALTGRTQYMYVPNESLTDNLDISKEGNATTSHTHTQTVSPP